MDYKNGKIYRIICEETGRQYIGSTCSTLVKRLSNHKRKTNMCTSKDFINPKIFLIEDYSCERKDQLTARERYFIETMDCVNKQIPGRTNAEWREDNREKLQERQQKYREDNREKIKERYEENKEKYNENKRKNYHEKNREKILEKNKKYREDNREKLKKYYHENREKILEQQAEKVTCECGCIVARTNLAAHKRTKRHNKLIKLI